MLTNKEIIKLVSLLDKIDHPKQGLPQAVFESLAKLVPFIGCELVVMNNKNEFLLTWRDDIWWKGWHIPGGLMRQGETFKERLRETASQELGVNIKKCEFLFPMNYNKCVRGHSVSLVFLCIINTTPKVGKFFSKMPKNIIKEHRALWAKLSNNIKK